jgi:hypothetical protein
MISEEMLSRPPTDPEHAKDDVKLYELWKEARDMLDIATAGEKKFDEWDSRVQSFLSPAEREFYLSPYDGLDMRYLDYRSVSRMNHLTKILLNRRGLNKQDFG